MKTFFSYYLKTIKHIQSILVLGSIGLFLIAAPIHFAFNPDFLTGEIQSILYTISFASLVFVMSIRPLADIFSTIGFIRPLVVLRKGLGILSASIIVSFMLSKMILFGPEFFVNFLSLDYWMLSDYSLFAHLGDVTAVILLITSNIFSKKILGKNWKRVQKLAYVYFYSGGIYEFLAFDDLFALWSMVIVSLLVVVASFINYRKKKHDY